MGSCAYTCCVSGLPIEAGDKVRVLLLTRNPYTKDGDNACYIHDIWAPRTLPLTAKYNDYGSVEEVEEGYAREVWLDGLQVDLCETGWGDNACHDVPARKNMTFDELLNALQEGRVGVKDFDVVDFLNTTALLETKEGKRPRSVIKQEPSEAEGVPSLHKIEALLKANKQPLYGAKDGDKPESFGFMVDETEYGCVRVRWHSYGNDWNKDEQKLSALLPLFTDYVAAVVAGSGSYANSADMRIRPKPGTANTGGPPQARKEPLTVCLTMIREDVWQGLLTVSLSANWNGTKVTKFPEYLASVENLAEKLEYQFTEPTFGSETPTKYRTPDLGTWVFSDRHLPCHFGVGRHIRLMHNKCGGKFPTDFVKTIAEYGFVSEVLGATRFIWRKSNSAGPQSGEWKTHVEVNKVLLDVSKQARKEQQKRYR